MSDRRLEILKAEYYKYFRPSFPSDERTYAAVDTTLCIKEETDAIKNSMDEYMKECILEFIEYVAKNKIEINNDNGEPCCYLSNGEGITPKQLFENFL